MKKKLTNNLGMKLLSLGLATIIWLLIVNIEDPVKTDKISGVKVQVVNEDVIESLGQVYEIIEGEKVDVIVKGKQSVVNSLVKEDITVVADMKDLSKVNAIDLVASCPKLESTGGSVELGSVKNMRVVLEDVEEDTFKVELSMTGEVEKGYYTSTELMKTKPTFIQVSAAKSVFDRIKTIQVVVDVKNRSEDYNIALTPKAYDENGSVIESQNLSFSSDLINVAVTILPTKKIPVEVVLEGKPATGYEVTEHIYEPKELLIAASADILELQSKLTIPVDISGLTQSGEIAVPLKDYLPEGVLIADNKTELVNNLKIEKLGEKEVTFSTSNIDVKLSTLDANFSFVDPGVTYRVRVSALNEELNSITIADLHPFIDMAGYNLGEHTVKIQFNSPYQVTVVGNGEVAVKLKDSTEVIPTSDPIIEGIDQPTSSSNAGSNEHENVGSTESPTPTIEPTVTPPE